MTALCVVFGGGWKEFTKREQSGGGGGVEGKVSVREIRVETFDKRRGRGEGERDDKGREKRKGCHQEIKKNEWLYLSVIKTVPKNKQTRGNKPRARL